MIVNGYSWGWPHFQTHPCVYYWWLLSVMSIVYCCDVWFIFVKSPQHLQRMTWHSCLLRVSGAISWPSDLQWPLELRFFAKKAASFAFSAMLHICIWRPNASCKRYGQLAPEPTSGWDRSFRRWIIRLDTFRAGTWRAPTDWWTLWWDSFRGRS